MNWYRRATIKEAFGWPAGHWIDEHGNPRAVVETEGGDTHEKPVVEEAYRRKGYTLPQIRQLWQQGGAERLKQLGLNAEMILELDRNAAMQFGFNTLRWIRVIQDSVDLPDTSKATLQRAAAGLMKIHGKSVANRIFQVEVQGKSPLGQVAFSLLQQGTLRTELGRMRSGPVEETAFSPDFQQWEQQQGRKRNKSAQAKETITAAAIIGQDGKPYHVPPPGRHHHVIRMLVDMGHKKPIVGEQGFMTSANRFVNRIEGARIAIESGQIQKLQWPPNLYSEDLW